MTSRERRHKIGALALTVLIASLLMLRLPEASAEQPAPALALPPCGEPCEPPAGVEPDPLRVLVDGHDVWYWHARAVRLARRLERLQGHVAKLRAQRDRYKELAGLAARLDRELGRRGSPIRGRDAAAAGVRSRVSPVALVAISGVESSFGLEACGYNSTGLGACGRAWTEITLCGRRWSLAGLDSWYAGLRMTGELIRCLWPRARTVHDLQGYCAGCPSWAGQVASIMARFGSGPGVLP